MTQWGVDPVGGPWLSGAIALLLVFALIIGPAGKRLTPRKRIILRTLRALTALILLFALWRPTLVATETRKLPGSLIILTDVSRSCLLYTSPSPRDS